MLQKYMTERGLTTQQFAELCGLKQYEVSRLKSGGRKASAKIAKKIEKATNGDITRYDLRPDIYEPAQ